MNDPDARLRQRQADPTRLAALQSTRLLDTPAETRFDTLTQRAAALLNVPATFLALVDRDRDFYKSEFGLGPQLSEVRQIEGRTFCHYAIGAAAPLVIDDAARHPVYRHVPTVTTLGVRAYLGIPLVLSDGEIIGSFCAIAFEPRAWSTADVETMKSLANAALAEMADPVDPTPDD